MNDISKKLFSKHLPFDEYIELAKQKCLQMHENENIFVESDHVYSMEVTKEELGIDDGTDPEDFITQI